MRHRPARLLLPSAVLLSTLTLGGCSWFNDVGEHFPVVGERCEYWQCFTEYGRQQSDAIREAKAKAQQEPPAGSAPPPHVEFIDPTKAEPVGTPP